ncbi:MAG: hypothetical protein PVF51_09080 [Nitrospirota bacterium]|jgi:hypothetical protein
MQHPPTSASGFVLIASSSSLIWHLFVKRYGPAVLGAAVTTAVLFRVVDYLVFRALEPYFYLAMVSSLLPAVAIAALIGLPITIYRARQTKR